MCEIQVSSVPGLPHFLVTSGGLGGKLKILANSIAPETFSKVPHLASRGAVSDLNAVAQCQCQDTKPTFLKNSRAQEPLALYRAKIGLFIAEK